MNFKSFVAMIRLYLKTFVAVVAVVFVLCAGWIVLFQMKYVSHAQLLVSMNGSSTAEAYENDSVIAARVSTYLTLLNSDVVSQHVIDKLKLKTTAPELSTQINAINVPPKTAVIDIAVTDSSAAEARQIAQTVADEFVGFTNAMETPTGEGSQKVVTTVVTAASEPHRQRLMPVILGLLSLAFALVVGAMAVWLRSALDPVIRVGYRAGVAAKVPVLGEVTITSSDPEADSSDSISEFRQVRHRLRAAEAASGSAVVRTGETADGILRERASEQSSVLEVTAVDDESGLDTREVAYRLARVMMLGGAKAVLVETGTNDSEDEPSSAGEIVAGEAGMPDMLSVTEVSNEAISGLREDYDAVVIAAPPVLSTLAPNQVSDTADSVVLLVALDQTKRLDVEQAATKLSGWGVPFRGVILVR
jgi:capsular polysaccharide biosynthesis protein